MKQLDFSLSPAVFFIWKYPQEVFSIPHAMEVPAGMEAVVVRNSSNLSDPFRAGDVLTVGAHKKPFTRKNPGREIIYFCRRMMNEPLGWGLGGMPCPQKDGMGVFGASGKMRVGVSNARVLVRHALHGPDTMAEKELGRLIEPLIIENVRPVLIRSVARLGPGKAEACLDELSTETRDALKPHLAELGLSLESWTVACLICR